MNKNKNASEELHEQLDGLWTLPRGYASHWFPFPVNSHFWRSNHRLCWKYLFLGLRPRILLKTSHGTLSKSLNFRLPLTSCVSIPGVCRTPTICSPQRTRYLLFVEFPRVHGTISNPVFYLILLIIPGRVRSGMRKANLERLFVVKRLIENPRSLCILTLSLVFFEVHCDSFR